MQRTDRKIGADPLFSWARGAALCSLLVLAAGGSAFADPTLTVLHSFAGGANDGAAPFAGLIADGAGNLYGTTTIGGHESECREYGPGYAGCGVVFKLSPDGTFALLHSFAGGASDGIHPGGLIADGRGNLFGMTVRGGPGCPILKNGIGNFGEGRRGCGVVFMVSPDGTFTVLHSFAGDANDGDQPSGGLIADRSGNLYGVTQGGGSGSGCNFGCGVVFKLSPDGTSYTVLHFFAGGASDGEQPSGDLVADRSGNLYGTTNFGGSECRAVETNTDVAKGTRGCGVVFKLSPGGTYTLLHAFAGGHSDGTSPNGGLIADSSSNLYGTTSSGGGSGCHFGCGVVFKLSPDGTYTLLHTFTGSDGTQPSGGLIVDRSGNLYGMTQNGGSRSGCNFGCGVVFKLSPDGAYTLLHSFAGGVSDGEGPVAGLTADSSGNLYGTTVDGGASGMGVVFKLAGTGFVP